MRSPAVMCGLAHPLKNSSAMCKIPCLFRIISTSVHSRAKNYSWWSESPANTGSHNTNCQCCFMRKSRTVRWHYAGFALPLCLFQLSIQLMHMIRWLFHVVRRTPCVVRIDAWLCSSIGKPCSAPACPIFFWRTTIFHLPPVATWIHESPSQLSMGDFLLWMF